MSSFSKNADLDYMSLLTLSAFFAQSSTLGPSGSNLGSQCLLMILPQASAAESLNVVVLWLCTSTADLLAIYIHDVHVQILLCLAYCIYTSSLWLQQIMQTSVSLNIMQLGVGPASDSWRGMAAAFRIPCPASALRIKYDATTHDLQSRWHKNMHRMKL